MKANSPVFLQSQATAQIPYPLEVTFEKAIFFVFAFQTKI